MRRWVALGRNRWPSRPAGLHIRQRPLQLLGVSDEAEHLSGLLLVRLADEGSRPWIASWSPAERWIRAEGRWWDDEDSAPGSRNVRGEDVAAGARRRVSQRP